MKYISILIFAALMIWTWNLIHTSQAISLETHSSIQAKMSTILENAIKLKKPELTEFKMNKVWTEFIKDNKIKAHFTYSFKESSSSGAIETQISGEGILQKQPDDASGLEKWSLQEVKTTNDVLVFQEALVVSTGEETKADEKVVQPKDESKTQPAKDHK